MSEHPDLEALSAGLDGEGRDADGHVASCPVCQATLAELASVQAAIGGLVAPPRPEIRERALAAALAAADGWGRHDEEPASAPGAHLLRPSRFRWWLTGSAAAAVVVLVLLTAALVSGGLGGRQSDDAGTALSAGPAQDNALKNGALEAAPPPGDQVTDGGDLGDVRDLATLRSRVAARSAAAGSAAASAEAPATVAGPQPRVVGTRVCEIEARTARPQLGVVVYAANVRYQATPAVVLGFADRPGAPPVTLLVLAPGESCRVLAESTTP